jgi:sugar phosphate isomerase/epimerase
MRELTLDQLTVVGVAPLEMIGIAAELGYDGIGPIALSAPEFDLPIQPFADDDRLCAKMADLLRATGVRLFNVDGFPLFPTTDVTAFRRPIENCARLRARSITTLIFDENRTRAEENFARLCEMAEEAGLLVLLEFTSISQVGSLERAVEFLQRANRPNAALQVDACHLAHSGGTPADLSRVDPQWVGSAQLCDGPLGQTPEQYAYNILYERALPGSGELPLTDFLKALPRSVPIGVEVPLKSLSDRGVAPLDRARLALEATRRTLDAAGMRWSHDHSNIRRA